MNQARDQASPNAIDRGSASDRGLVPHRHCRGLGDNHDGIDVELTGSLNRSAWPSASRRSTIRFCPSTSSSSRRPDNSGSKNFSQRCTAEPIPPGLCGLPRLYMKRRDNEHASCKRDELPSPPCLLPASPPRTGEACLASPLETRGRNVMRITFSRCVTPVIQHPGRPT